MTFEDYLRKAGDHQIIDFHIRVYRCDAGGARFYIHPQGKDGATIDYDVYDNSVSPTFICGEFPEQPLFGEPG